MKSGDYILLTPDDIAMEHEFHAMLATVTSTNINSVKYKFLDQNGKKRMGMFYGYTTEDFITIGNYKDKPVYGSYSDNRTNFGSLLEHIVEKEKNHTIQAEASLKLSRQLESQARIHAQELPRLTQAFETDYIGSMEFWRENLSPCINDEGFHRERRNYVRQWFKTQMDFDLDDEQADAVSEVNNNTKVTARAGSGKTRTLVAKAIFLIKQCNVEARQILILAFNKKAVQEIIARLSLALDGNLPHVKTFHSLAWSIVQPSDDILFDEKESEEGMRLSLLIDEIIRRELASKNSSIGRKIVSLMEESWETTLASLTERGFRLEPDEFLTFRENLSERTVDLRKVKSVEDRIIGNYLFRRKIKYQYRKPIYTFPEGSQYIAGFELYDKEVIGEKIIIETTESDQQAEFWNSPDRGPRSKREAYRRFDLTDLKPEQIKDRLSEKFDALGIELTPMSKDELIKALQERSVNDFVSAVQSFLTRCQKDLVWPKQLADKINSHKESFRIEPSYAETRLLLLFWETALEIYQLYESELHTKNLTDFDRLMAQAADQISEGSTHFVSKVNDRLSHGDISKLDYLFIDEYQDFSHLFNLLRSAILKQNQNVKFFCVGDDWQAINRFAGSNLQYFNQFRAIHSEAEELSISTNYRSAKSIVNLGNNIMLGKRAAAAVPKQDAPTGVIYYVDDSTQPELNPHEDHFQDQFSPLLLNIVRIIQHELGLEKPTSKPDKNADPTIAILSRNSAYDGCSNTKTIKRRLSKYLPQWQLNQIDFSTAHSYKGKQAECIILLSPTDYNPGHPNNVFLSLLGDTFEDFIEDERRLLYVAATRAKTTLYILQNQSNDEDSKCSIYDFSSIPPTTFILTDKITNLYSGDQIHLILEGHDRTIENSGTFPIKDQLNADNFSWKEHTKRWTKSFPSEQLPDTSAYRRHLSKQPWFENAISVKASFGGDHETISYLIDGGEISRLDRNLSQDQLEELEVIDPLFSEQIRAVIESLYLDYEFDWPIIGYEYQDSNGKCNDSCLEVAWPEHQIGIALPSIPHDKFDKDDWKVFPVSQVSVSTILKQCHFVSQLG